MDKEKLIKIINLCTTDVISLPDYDDNKFIIDNYDINKYSSYTLFDIIIKFNKLYIHFKKNVKNLNTIKYNSEEFIIKSFYLNKDSSLKTISLYNVLKNKTNYEPYFDKELILYHSNNDNYYYKIYTYTHGIRVENSKLIDLDKSLIKQYFKILEEYELLFNAYLEFKNGLIFGDGKNLITSTITGNDLLYNLEYFKFNFGIINKVFFESSYKLGDTMEKNIEIKELHAIDKFTYDELISIDQKIRVHKKYLPKLYE